MKPAMMPWDPFSSENSECLGSLDLLWPPGGLVTIWKTVFRMSTKSKPQMYRVRCPGGRHAEEVPR